MSQETLYVVIDAELSGGDVAGILVSEKKVWWGHMSSGRKWLVKDLTTTFPDRADQLAAAFPGGYTVELIPIGGELPASIAHFWDPL